MTRIAKVPLLVALFSLALVVSALAPTQSEITLETSDDCYVSGDTVSFTLANGSDSVFWVNHTPPWSIRDVSADSLIFPLFVFWVFTSVDTGESATYNWDQKDYHGNQVSAGTYLVKITGSLGIYGQSVTVADTFDVGGASAVVPRTWGGLKSAWK